MTLSLPRLPLLPEPGAARAATLRGVVPRERAVQVVQVLGLRVVPRAEERRRRLGADPAAGALLNVFVGRDARRVEAAVVEGPPPQALHVLLQLYWSNPPGQGGASRRLVWLS